MYFFIATCRISAEERDMIVAGRSFDAKAQEEELKTPTLSLVGSFGKIKHLIIDLIHQIWTMLKSPAVLVVMATDFCCGWGNACIISMTPTFMKVGFDN